MTETPADGIGEGGAGALSDFQPQFLLRPEAGRLRTESEDSQEQGHRADRPFRLRQIHFPAHLNRMNETIRNTRVVGEILLDGQDILQMDVVGLRRRVGMVFQRPNPFPKSIYDNVAYGLRINGYQGPARRSGGAQPAPRRAVGRSEGLPAQIGVRAFRRPAAAAVHRARSGRRSGSAAARRAVLGARSRDHRQDRRADVSAEGQLHDGHRHAQHAAGRARQRFHGLHAGWKTDRAQRNIEALYHAADPRTEAYITGRFG